MKLCALTLWIAVGLTTLAGCEFGVTAATEPCADPAACDDEGDGGPAHEDTGIPGTDSAPIDVYPTDVCPGGILEGSYTVAGEKDIDALKACTKVTGDLKVSDNVPSLSVPKLTEIGGALDIETAELTSVSLPVLEKLGHLPGVPTTLATLSLPALTEVSGDFFVTGTEMLTGLSLPALATVDGSLEIREHWELERVELPVLANVAGTFDLSANPVLERVSLPLLASVGGLAITRTSFESLTLPALTQAGSLYLDDNKMLTTARFPLLTRTTLSPLAIRNNWYLDTVEFPLLESVVMLEITGNLGLISFSFPKLETGDIRIEDNPPLTLFFLPVLARSDEITVQKNTDLTYLGFPSLTTTRDLLVVDNANLNSIVVPKLDSVHGTLEIGYNPWLDDIVLPELDVLDGIEPEHGLYVHHNDQLAALALEALTAVKADCSILENANLSSLSLPELASSGRLLIVKDALASLSLPKLTSVDGSLIVQQNEKLTSIELSALTSVGDFVVGLNNVELLSVPLLLEISGALDLVGDNVMQRLSLPKVASIGAELTILYQAELVSLDLSALTTLGGNLTITGNPRLATSQAIAVRDRLVEYTGTATIEGNYP